MNNPSVSIVMGSISDKETLAGAIEIFEDFQVNYEVQVQSAHRTADEMLQFAKDAKGRGVKIIIAAAGGAAHLPGMIASVTTLPVIGVPVPLKNLAGLDSLLSIAQMPAGIPVATVGIANSKNAALLAVRILAISDEGLDIKLQEFHLEQKKVVKEQNKKLN
ncbi:MAG: 5-(carboxyamino)imidazole ribonucleotide mutase [Candidatus Nanopelagicales bacterium]